MKKRNMPLPQPFITIKHPAGLTVLVPLKDLTEFVGSMCICIAFGGNRKRQPMHSRK